MNLENECNYLICPREVDIEGDCWCLKKKYMELAIDAVVALGRNGIDSDEAYKNHPWYGLGYFDCRWQALLDIKNAFAIPPDQTPTIGTGEKEWTT